MPQRPGSGVGGGLGSDCRHRANASARSATCQPGSSAQVSVMVQTRPAETAGTATPTQPPRAAASVCGVAPGMSWDDHVRPQRDERFAVDLRPRLPDRSGGIGPAGDRQQVVEKSARARDELPFTADNEQGAHGFPAGDALPHGIKSAAQLGGCRPRLLRRPGGVSELADRAKDVTQPVDRNVDQGTTNSRRVLPQSQRNTVGRDLHDQGSGLHASQRFPIDRQVVARHGQPDDIAAGRGRNC